MESHKNRKNIKTKQRFVNK